MKHIKLVASDLDGTLLNQQKELTPRLFHTLKTLDKMGVLFIPATGRPFSTVPQSIRTLPFLKYIITSNGAAVYNVTEKKNMIEMHLSCEAVEIIIDIIKELPIITEFFTNGQAYIAKNIYDNISSFSLTESHIAYIQNSRIPISDFWEEMKKNKSNLENINLIFQDMELRKEIRKKIQETNLVSVTSSTTKNLEITSILATKANALEMLCKKLNLEPKHILAMGDGDNDIPMLQFAGIGVAMANGNDEIKQAANLIADDCDHFGAAKILEQIIKAKKGV